MPNRSSVLFFRTYPKVDGTFTLLIRLSRYLDGKGYSVYFLLKRQQYAAGIIDQIQSTAKIIFTDELDSMKQSGTLPPVDIIHGIVSGDALYWLYTELKQVYFPAAAAVIGSYHPRAYYTETWFGPTQDTILTRKLFRKIPPANLCFMNESVRAENARLFRCDFSKSPIIPLPIQVGPFNRALNQVVRNRVVSVGRLVEFKRYVMPVIDCIIDLRKKGMEYDFHVYGDGPLLGEVQAYVEEKRAGDFVKLFGPLDYSRFAEVVEPAGVFVGMGTAMLESSALGVPSLIAIESNDQFTYGWSFDQQGYEVGEVLEGKEMMPYDSFLQEAWNANGDEYKRMSIASWNRAKMFSIEAVGRSYEEFINQADDQFIFEVSKWRLLFVRLARQLSKFKPLVKRKYIHK